MTRKDIKVIQARIKEEQKNITELLEELKRKNLFDQQSGLIDDNFFLRGVGSILHDYYVAVENILEIICSELDERLPEGSNWHMELLKQASLEIPEVRPAIVSKSTLFKLDRYRAFRHVFRNVYGFNLDVKRITELVNELPETAESFSKDISSFCALLDQIDQDNR